MSTSRSTSPSPSSHRPVYHHRPTDFPPSLPYPPPPPYRHPLSPLPTSHSHLPHPPHPPAWARPPPLSIRQKLSNNTPFLLWVATTALFVLGFTFFRPELFEVLDGLSEKVRGWGVWGGVGLGGLIVITCIPPLPLYSTLIVLSGYSLGPFNGFLISYTASLLGAIMVFVGTRWWMNGRPMQCIQSSPHLSSTLLALSRRPSLLFLLRLAPYPYNLMNVLLASAPFKSLSLGTYVACTAASLGKLWVHCLVGGMLREGGGGLGGAPVGGWEEWKGEGGGGGWRGNETGQEWDRPPYHSPPPHPSHPHPHPYPHHPSHSAARLKFYSTWFGIVLCFLLFAYLMVIARRAVKEVEEEEAARVLEAGGGGGVRLEDSGSGEGGDRIGQGDVGKERYEFELGGQGARG